MRYKSLFKECNSWSDFQGQLESLNKKEKGNAFELLTKLYFKINPVYSFYDEVWVVPLELESRLQYFDFAIPITEELI